MVLYGNVIFLPEDINMALSFSNQGWTVIYAGDSNEVPPTFIKAPVLLPPQSAVTEDIAGNMEAYQAIYYAQLRGNEVAVTIIDSILAALYQGINIAILFEEQELSHVQFFKDFFYNMYGIVIGDVNSLSADLDISDPCKLLNIAIAIYCIRGGNVMSPYDFICEVNEQNVQYLYTYNDPYHNPFMKLRTELQVDYSNPMALLEQSSWLNHMKNNNIQGGSLCKLEE